MNARNPQKGELQQNLDETSDSTEAAKEEISTEQTPKTKHTPKYAWVVALGGAFSQVAIIICNQLFQFNVAFIADDFGQAATSLAIASSLYGLCYAGFGMVWGSIADTIGFRKSMTIASCGAGLWCVLFGLLANDLLTVSIFLGLTGAFASGLSIAVIPKLISTWFSPSTRGKGITLGLAGGYLTAMAMGIVMPALILNIGWRGCFIALGCVCLVLSPVLFCILRDSPASVGTVPFGTKDPCGTPPATTKKDKGDARERMLRVLKLPITWKFGAIYILWQFMMTAENTYLTLALVESGYTLVIAGLVSTVYEGFSMLGGIVFPILSDRFPRKYVLAAVSLVAGVAYASLYFVFELDSLPILFMTIAVVGCFCAVLPLLQTTVAECFPPDLRGTGPGTVGTISLVGRFGGPLVAGWFIVNLGAGSSSIFTMFAGGCLVAVGILSLLWLPKTGGRVGDPNANEQQADSQK